MYPSKVILFGEYLVLNDSDLLGTPLYMYAGEWSYGQQTDNRLLLLAEFINREDLLFVNIQKFKEDIANYITFKSNIPQGYGCGSSGALISAVYDKYVEKKDTLLTQRHLSRLESFYHGSSSGVDPILSLYKKTMLFQKKGTSIIDEISLENFYLFDSGQKRTAEHFVSTFLKKMENKEYANKIAHLTQITNDAISLLINNGDGFLEAFVTISKMQLELFDFAIPNNTYKIWKEANDNGIYFKICGAGGGGYFLVFSLNSLDSDKYIPLST